MLARRSGIGHRIDPTGVPGMTAPDTLESHEAPAAGTVFFDCLLGIRRAAGVKTAAGRKNGRYYLAISGNYGQQ